MFATHIPPQKKKNISYGTVQCDETNPAEADEFQNRISCGPNI